MASHLLICDMLLWPLSANYTVFVTSNNVDFVADGVRPAAGAAPVVEEAVVEEEKGPVEDVVQSFAVRR